MEIHSHQAHPEVSGHRKKWTSYLWEFLMLFLAVTLGFIVENQRERITEHKRELQYIHSLLQDLETDTAMYEQAIVAQDESNRNIDTLIGLLKSPDRNQQSGKIYFMARQIPFDDVGLIMMNKTYQQMKGSGNLRLIQDYHLMDSLGFYYEFIPEHNRIGPGQMQFENRHDLYRVYNKLFDAMVFQKMMRIEDWPAMPENNPPLLTNDPTIINELCMSYQNMYSTRKALDQSAAIFKQLAMGLILEIKKSYSIK